ncbi:MAG: hypothetical protein ACD_75C00206G0001, partial [uncultured bacterium]
MDLAEIGGYSLGYAIRARHADGTQGFQIAFRQIGRRHAADQDQGGSPGDSADAAIHEFAGHIGVVLGMENIRAEELDRFFPLPSPGDAPADFAGRTHG